MVPLTVGEKWYLRLILYNHPVTSFNHARTIDEIVFQTFQEAALARNLVEDENEAKIAFQWATLHSSPPELRTLFATRIPNCKNLQRSRVENEAYGGFST